MAKDIFKAINTNLQCLESFNTQVTHYAKVTENSLATPQSKAAKTLVGSMNADTFSVTQRLLAMESELQEIKDPTPSRFNLLQYLWNVLTQMTPWVKKAQAPKSDYFAKLQCHFFQAKAAVVPIKEGKAVPSLHCWG